jgi:hypothetical protein
MDHERVVRLLAARVIAKEPFGIAPVRGAGPRARHVEKLVHPGQLSLMTIQLHAR